MPSHNSKALITRLGLLTKLIPSLGITAKLAKLLICLLFLVNIRSWPLFWHCMSFQFYIMPFNHTHNPTQKSVSSDLSLLSNSSIAGYPSAQCSSHRRKNWGWKMTGGTQSHRLVRTRLEWLYRIIHGQVSDTSFLNSSPSSCISPTGIDECDFNGHLSNSSYAKVIHCSLPIQRKIHDFH